MSRVEEGLGELHHTRKGKVKIRFAGWDSDATLVQALWWSLANSERDQFDQTLRADHVLGPDVRGQILADIHNETVLIAENEDGEGIGFLMWKLNTSNAGRNVSSAHLVAMFVKPDWRGMGIGSALMRQFLTLARDEEVDQVTLGVYAQNVKAIKFYQWFGFWSRSLNMVKDLEKPDAASQGAQSSDSSDQD